MAMMGNLGTAAVALASLLGTVMSWSAIEQSPSVDIAFGSVKGNWLAGGNVREFVGVPFATAERFQIAKDWNAAYANGGVLDARQFGPICPQPNMLPGFTDYAEDCLVLNIWTPAQARSGSLPVMYFIHGGSFVHGTGNLYNGSVVAEKHNAVVVSINYRLASFGFFAPRGGITNFGLRDQQSGLRWVREHIEHFGGDPAKVMIYGESAGAMSVQMQALIPSSHGLFSSMLSESGFPSTRPLDYAISTSESFAQEVGCMNQTSNADDVLSCMKTVPLEAMLKSENARSGNPFTNPGWSPVTDYDLFPANALKILLTGAFNATGMLNWVVGSNTDEGTMFVYPEFKLGMNATQYRTFMKSVVDGHGATPLTASMWKSFYTLYPPSETKDNRALASAVFGDATFICGSRFYLRNLQRKGLTRTWNYHFDYLRDPACYPKAPKDWKVSHASELPYSFDQPLMDSSTCGRFTPAGEHLAETMGSYWEQFASGADDGWSKWNSTAEANIVFTRSGATATEFKRRAEYCDFWETTFKYRSND